MDRLLRDATIAIEGDEMTPNTIKTAVLGLAAVIAAVLGWFAWRATDPTFGTGPAEVAAPEKPASSATRAPSAGSGQGETPAPSAAAPGERAAFDIVRVEPSGDAVVAGRAEPGAMVELLRDGQVIATEKANGAGEFVITPPQLEPGDHQLRLRTQGEGASERTVVVSIPRDGKGEVLVVASEAGKPAEVLQQPAAPAADEAQAPAPGQDHPSAAALPLRIGAVEVEGGRLFVQGEGPAGERLRIHLNNAPVADATVGDDGKWSLTVEKGVTPGGYAVRVDQLDGGGKVVARSETPFDYSPQAASAPPQAPSPELPTAPQTAEDMAPATPPASVESSPPPSVTARPSAPVKDAGTPPDAANPVVAEVGTVTIKRGDNLWSISQGIYGKGIRYTVIYDANTDQIRDPNLIYPDQVFVVPKASD